MVMTIQAFRGVGRANNANNVGNANNANGLASSKTYNHIVRTLPKGKTSSKSSRLSRKSERDATEMQA